MKLTTSASRSSSPNWYLIHHRQQLINPEMQLLVSLVRVRCTSLYTAIKIDSVSSSNSHAVKCKYQLSVLLENLVLKQTSGLTAVCVKQNRVLDRTYYITQWLSETDTACVCVLCIYFIKEQCLLEWRIARTLKKNAVTRVNICAFALWSLHSNVYKGQHLYKTLH